MTAYVYDFELISCETVWISRSRQGVGKRRFNPATRGAPRLVSAGGRAPFGAVRTRLGEHHRESRTLAGRGRDGKFPAMAVEDVLDDGKPKPGSAFLPARGDIDPVEALGQARQVLGRNPRSIVDD